MRTAEQVMAEIRDYIAANFMVEFGDKTTPQTDLFEAEFIDSFGFVELVTHLEQTYAIKLNDDDMASPSIGTLEGIHKIVLDRLQEAGGG